MKICFASIAACIMAFSYYEMAMWKYILATLTLLAFFRFYYPNYKDFLGLNFNRIQIFSFLFISLVCALVVEFLSQYFLHQTSVHKESEMLNSIWVLQPLSQSLNEEMIFRALLFSWLQTKIASPLKQNICMTLVFSFGHLIFCYFMFGVTLNAWVMLSFLSATFAMNFIFLQQKNILQTWAIHFGVNFSLFGGKYYQGTRVLNDAEKFNLILGEPLFAGLSVLFMIGTLTYFLGRKNAT